MASVWHELADRLENGCPIALATVIRVRGSVPQEVGAKMVIHAEGRHAGTVGGGCGEAAVMRVAQDVLESGSPVTVAVDLTGDITPDSAAICGGMMDVFVERLPSTGFGFAEVTQLLASLASGESCAVATVIAVPPGGPRRVGDKTILADAASLHEWLGVQSADVGALVGHADAVLDSRKPALLSSGGELPVSPTEQRSVEHRQDDPISRAGELALFVEPLVSAPQLIIVGAGHIAQPLAVMGALCGFRVTVLDDRSSFANSGRFPDAETVIAAPMPETLRHLHLPPGCYVVLVTRGHQHDLECLIEIIDRPLAYLGMIGSRRRIRGVFQLLRDEMAVDPRLLDRIHAPIGLDIGAKTPAEIAVSILSEVISVYRGGRLTS